MALELLGPHVLVMCRACGLEFVAGYEGPASAGRPAVCPNCGDADARLPTDATMPGQPVLVDKATLQLRPPRRWEVVALRPPHNAHEIWVKRVVGLPGETISLAEGDLHVDGRIVRKNLAEQRALAVLVHDDRFRSSDADSCWQAGEGSKWTVTGTGFACRMDPSNQSEPLDWLTYRHIRRNGSSAQPTESVVVDVSGFNQTHPVRDAHPVRDLALSFSAVLKGTGTLYLRGTNGSQEFTATIAADGTAELWQRDKRVAAGKATTPLTGSREKSISRSSIRRACWRSTGAPSSNIPLNPRWHRHRNLAPFSLAAGPGLLLEVDRLRIWRDVYYAPPAMSAAATQLPLPLRNEEFFVLADNSPLGVDSRYAEFGPAVSAKLLVGKPFIAFGMACLPDDRGRTIQVPGLFQIRYIR